MNRAGATPQVGLDVVRGDLLDQADADVLVNAWNRNFVPRWLLRPTGVSGALKARTGPDPWRALARHGRLEVSQAVATDGGHLPQRLIHVAGLHAHWRASERSVLDSTRNAVELAWREGARLVAAPLIGAGTGGLSSDRAHELMRAAVQDWSAAPGAPDVMTVRLVVYRPTRTARPA